MMEADRCDAKRQTGWRQTETELTEADRQMDPRQCCLSVCRSSLGVEVWDFGRSWRSGLAFLALIQSIDPGLVDLRARPPTDPLRNLEEAFRIARDHLGIPALLEPHGETHKGTHTRLHTQLWGLAYEGLEVTRFHFVLQVFLVLVNVLPFKTFCCG